MLLALHGPSRPATSRLLVQVSRVLAAILGAPARFVRHRHLLSTMAEMSDAELKDIGLARPDVSDATALPLGSDVGSFLAARAHDRDRYSSRH